MAFKPGDRLRNYTIVKELGRGRFGITYLAKDQNNQNCVVKKTISDGLIEELSADPVELKRLEDKIWQEGLRLAQCQNPHIVKIKDSFREGDRTYLIEEFIAGDNLEHLPNKTLSESEALNYIRQIGGALICVHENNLIHRDVKPANIMIRAGKSEAVLIDFGLARGFDNVVTTVKASTADGFAPLELYNPTGKQGPYTDVYSLAATLYVLLTGVVPPSAIQRNATDEFRKELTAPKKLNPAISDRTNQAILKGLAIHAEDRSKNIEEWLKLLSIRPYPNISSLVKEPFFWVIVGTVAAIVGAVGTWVPIFKTDSPSPSLNSTPVLEKQK
jgi:serine/threonine protein kinase